MKRRCPRCIGIARFDPISEGAAGPGYSGDENAHIDRTVPPLVEPKYPPITELDVRKATPPAAVRGQGAAETADVGMDLYTPVTPDYKKGDDKFTGKINKVTIDLKKIDSCRRNRGRKGGGTNRRSAGRPRPIRRPARRPRSWVRRSNRPKSGNRLFSSPIPRCCPPLCDAPHLLVIAARAQPSGHPKPNGHRGAKVRKGVDSGRSTAGHPTSAPGPYRRCLISHYSSAAESKADEVSPHWLFSV